MDQATLHDPYTKHKKKLTHTKYQMCDGLLDMPPLGSGKPSLMMSKVLALLPDGDEPGTLFLCVFLRRLPESMRCQLKAGQYETPDEMARAADDLWEDSAAINAPTGKQRYQSPADNFSGSNRQWCNSSLSPAPHRRLLMDYPSPVATSSAYTIGPLVS